MLPPWYSLTPATVVQVTQESAYWFQKYTRLLLLTVRPDLYPTEPCSRPSSKTSSTMPRPRQTRSPTHACATPMRGPQGSRRPRLPPRNRRNVSRARKTTARSATRTCRRRARARSCGAMNAGTRCTRSVSRNVRVNRPCGLCVRRTPALSSFRRRGID